VLLSDVAGRFKTVLWNYGRDSVPPSNRNPRIVIQMKQQDIIWFGNHISLLFNYSNNYLWKIDWHVTWWGLGYSLWFCLLCNFCLIASHQRKHLPLKPCSLTEDWPVLQSWILLQRKFKRLRLTPFSRILWIDHT